MHVVYRRVLLSRLLESITLIDELRILAGHHAAKPGLANEVWEADLVSALLAVPIEDALDHRDAVDSIMHIVKAFLEPVVIEAPQSGVQVIRRYCQVKRWLDNCGGLELGHELLLRYDVAGQIAAQAGSVKEHLVGALPAEDVPDHFALV